MTDLLIEEDQVTLVNLSLALEQATIAHESQNGHALYITESGMFPFWVELRPQPRYILLRSYLDFAPGVDTLDRLNFCNDINLRLYVPNVAVQVLEVDSDTKPRLVATYPIYYRDGVLHSHFIRLCRAFSIGMAQIQSEFDAEHQMLIPISGGSQA